MSSTRFLAHAVSLLSVLLLTALVSVSPVTALTFGDPQSVGDADIVSGNLAALAYKNSVYLVYLSGGGSPSTVYWTSSSTGLRFRAGQALSSVQATTDPVLVTLHGYLYCIFADGELGYSQFTASSQTWSSPTFFSTSGPINALSAGTLSGQVIATYCKSSGTFCAAAVFSQDTSTGALSLQSNPGITVPFYWPVRAAMITTYGNPSLLLFTKDSGSERTDLLQLMADGTIAGLGGSPAGEGSPSGYSAVQYGKPSGDCDNIFVTFYNSTGALSYYFYTSSPFTAFQTPEAITTPSYPDQITIAGFAPPVIFRKKLIVYFTNLDTNQVNAVAASTSM
jgi:hypothetical protein